MKLNFNEMNDFVYLYNKVSPFSAFVSIRDTLKGTDRIRCNYFLRLDMKYIQKIEPDADINSTDITDYYKTRDKLLKTLGFVHSGDGIAICPAYTEVIGYVG